MGWLAAAAAAAHARLAAAPVERLTRAIPRTGERIPAVGMGTWLTFDVGPEPVALGQRRAVLQAFFAGGGALIDTSPMYGRAEEVVGDLLGEPGRAAPVFSATKVWTSGRLLGERQLVRSMGYWRLRRFDLVQVHNMLDWTTHLPWLRDWQAQGKIRYLGITTSHGRLHEALEAAMRREPFDFVQFTYSLADRSAESRLLPLAADRGMAVIANRPFDGGDLFDRVRGRSLPGWAPDYGIANWAQFFLKFVISHPALACAIPATSRPDHMAENIGALGGPLPDAGARRRMAAFFDAL